METKKKSAATAAKTGAAHKMGTNAAKRSSTTHKAGSAASKEKSNRSKQDDDYDYFVVETYEVTEY